MNRLPVSDVTAVLDRIGEYGMVWRRRAERLQARVTELEAELAAVRQGRDVWAKAAEILGDKPK